MRFLDADMTSLIGVGSAGQFLQDVNSTGYELMAAGKLDAACEVFRFNTLVFPEDWNVWDSLGECWLKSGNTERAIESYQRSLELNPDNANAEKVLQEVPEKVPGS